MTLVFLRFWMSVVEKTVFGRWGNLFNATISTTTDTTFRIVFALENAQRHAWSLRSSMSTTNFLNARMLRRLNASQAIVVEQLKLAYHIDFMRKYCSQHVAVALNLFEWVLWRQLHYIKIQCLRFCISIFGRWGCLSRTLAASVHKTLGTFCFSTCGSVPGTICDEKQSSSYNNSQQLIP